MSLTTALFTGLTGMDVNTKSIDVIGHNITNVNTVGFKSSRTLFEAQLSQTFNIGSQPAVTTGGTNPLQIGLGVKLGATQKNFTNGSIQPTGIKTDLALEGDGFFVIERGGQRFYTRNGAFDLDADGMLVSGINGGRVQGFGIDENFNLVTGVGQDLEIPVGTLTIAKATSDVVFAGNLNASGDLATTGSLHQSQALVDGSTTGAATAGTDLTDLEDASNPGTPLFATGDVVTMTGVEKGGKALGTFTFEVGGTNTTDSDDFGTTLGDLMDFFTDATGLNTTVDGASVTVDGSGQINFSGNFGTINDLSLQPADVFSTGSPSQPFLFNKISAANGESVRTTFAVFDSLGTPLTADLSMVLVDKNTTGTTWRFYGESVDDTDLDLSLGTGTIEFNTFGALTQVNNGILSIDRANTGAIDPLTFNLDFTTANNFSAFTDTQSTLAAISQNGSPIGTLENFGIGEDGTITGAFTNGLTRTLGQVVLGQFANPEGLVSLGSNLYSVGPNSGLAVEVTPLSFGTGRILAGSLELSNVDLSQEFVNLIQASTGFSASTRVITTSDQLIQELLSIAR